jgi:hypothetical protein
MEKKEDCKILCKNCTRDKKDNIEFFKVCCVCGEYTYDDECYFCDILPQITAADNDLKIKLKEELDDIKDYQENILWIKVGISLTQNQMKRVQETVPDIQQ